jgi:hypothetical protein
VEPAPEERAGGCRRIPDDVFAYDEYVEKLETTGIKPKNVR